MPKLITGASGLLGQNLKLKADRPSHDKLDITQIITPGKYDKIINCAAYTNVSQAEIDKWDCFNVNVNGVLNLLEAYPTTPFVQISTEYAYNPVNFYSLTKKMAEDLCLYRGNCLIIRTLFKAFPYPYEYAFTDQFTEGDTVDKIAPLIEAEINNWNGGGKKIVYVGTGRKTLFELAKATNPNVKGNTTDEWSKITGVRYPKDYR